MDDEEVDDEFAVELPMPSSVRSETNVVFRVNVAPSVLYIMRLNPLIGVVQLVLNQQLCIPARDTV